MITLTTAQVKKLYRMAKFAQEDMKKAESMENHTLIEITIARMNTMYDVFDVIGLDWKEEVQK